MFRTLLCAATIVTGLVLGPSCLGAQQPAQLLANAREQIRLRNLDSATTLLHAVTMSRKADSAEHAEAFMWLGVVAFFTSTDSAASDAFRSALASKPLLMPTPILAGLDSGLAALWEHEQTIALCGESLPAWLGTTGGPPRSTALNSEARSAQGPELMTGPPLKYPDYLRHAEIQGRVMVRAIIDTAGHAARASLRVVSTAHPGFNKGVIDYAENAQFRAAVSSAAPVRSCIVFPVDFSIKQSAPN